MAHYVPIPKDLNDIKEKFIMGFTKRQVICFGIGLVLGAPVYFLTRASIGMSGAIFAMGAVAAPAILCGIYKKNGVFFRSMRTMTAISALQTAIVFLILMTITEKRASSSWITAGIPVQATRSTTSTMIPTLSSL